MAKWGKVSCIYEFQVLYSCHQCQHNRIQKTWSDRKCVRTDRVVDYWDTEHVFPDWCPLPDATDEQGGAGKWRRK